MAIGKLVLLFFVIVTPLVPISMCLLEINLVYLVQSRVLIEEVHREGRWSD